MKLLITIVGLILIIAGIITLAYKGFTYTTEEKIAQIGDLKLTTENQNRVYFPPILGAGSIITGIVLVVIARSKIKK